MPTQQKNYDLTVVIPIGHLDHDTENILRIVVEASTFGIKLILVLDKQTENSQKQFSGKIEQYGLSNFEIVSGSWGNPGGARNFGITLCQSKWIAFWDSDDIPNLSGIVQLMDEMHNSKCDLGIGIFSQYRKGRPYSEITHEEQDLSLDHKILANPGLWRFVFKREFIYGISFPESTCSEDILFLQRTLSREPKIYTSNHHIYTYVQGGLNQITKSPFVVDQILQVLKISVAELPEKTNHFHSLYASLIHKQILTVLKKGSALQRFRSFVIFVTVRKNVGICNFLCTLFFLVNLKYKAARNE
jgi:glycosyltransferase involved in cell wall biosynthesis